ncbi:uncharacterized protein J4E92_000393 [Alternaria infectoria]|uniref:uncharacterized protein n=1 Tax=Alternaria infectoria TaxID=45303 RepID=UPI00222017D1|nr:uncharacterized protein J4E92_000393 [Alternaria infectoria]KAI4939110.1 hypothetical protein J4E92_000393 [Alternaria infectoria]
MAHSSAANSPGYQTYAVPLAGGKRKRATANNQSESAEPNATPIAARSKRSRPNEKEYNAKYMAEMCFSAYKARLHIAGYSQYTADVANDWREDLVELFSHAALKGTIKQNAAARHVIPRLTTLIPHKNQKKGALVKDFAKHYETVRNDMMVIDRVMGNGFKVNEQSIVEVRECLNGLHYILAKGEQWRNVMPYTPLPMYRLGALRDLIKYSRPHHHLGDLVTNIEEMEGWLSPPPASFSFPPGSIDETMETLQKATEDKIARTSIGPDAQQMAEYRAQKAEALRLQKEEQARQQEKERLDEVQRVQAERDQLKQRIKSLEMTAAKERAQESVKKVAEAAATAQRDKSYQDQIAQQTTEINKLKNDLSNLSAKQAAQIKPDATTTSSLPVTAGQTGTSMNSSFSSNQTANSSFYQPKSSLGTSFGSSINGGSYGQLGSFGQVSHHPTPKDDDVQMTDARRVDSSQQHPSFGPFDPSTIITRGVGQSNPFNARITNGAPSGPFGISADDGNFKAACPAYKNGTCTLGRSCKLPHTACKFWLSGSCRFGGRCKHSHDPFFLTEAALKGQSKQFPRADQMVIDPVPAPRSSNFSQTNPLSSHLPGGSNPFGGQMKGDGRSTLQPKQEDQTFGFHTSNSKNPFAQAPSPAPAVRKPTLAERVTRGEQPTSFDNQTSFGYHTPPTGPRGNRSLADRITKNDQPMPHQPQHQHQPPTIRIEQSLEDIINASGARRNEKQAKPLQSETLCRWQITSPNGCTNPSCGYKHDPPKTVSTRAAKGGGVRGLRNPFSQIGDILRGNR